VPFARRPRATSGNSLLPAARRLRAAAGPAIGAGARWLRANSEHYLMVAAQQKVAARYQVTPPPPPRGAEVFWLRVYVPLYWAVPWRVRAAAMRLLPGSHRMTWTTTQHPRVPGQGHSR
jgi:hypothetical protein